MKKSSKLLIWDSVNRREIREHALTTEDVEEAFYDRNRFSRRTHTGKRGRNKDVKRYRIVGKGFGGEFITIIFGITKEGNRRVVTAFPSPPEDKALYKQRC
jgi:uncharacterized DUF497 family protein